MQMDSNPLFAWLGARTPIFESQHRTEGEAGLATSAQTSASQGNPATASPESAACSDNSLASLSQFSACL